MKAYRRATAEISPGGAYRWSLYRRWKEYRLGDLALFVMLNPSTADGTKDDPTIRRCVGFAGSWGFGALEVVNLYAYRATNPAELLRAPDPVGPENDAWIRQAAARASAVVCAWGAHPAAEPRSGAVLEILRAGVVPVRCLGTTKSGAPRHPLYTPAGLQPLPFGL